MKTKPEQPDSPEARRCIVGNIVAWHWAGEGGAEIREGTKHFSPGTKVYCLPCQWGDNYEQIVVIGRHRGQSKMHRMIIHYRYITNWRSQVVYSPAVLRLMDEWGEVPGHTAYWCKEQLSIYLEFVLSKRDREERSKDELARIRLAEHLLSPGTQEAK